MRESMLFVMTVLFGFLGTTRPLYGVTGRFVYANAAAFVSTLVILMTSMLVLSPCSVTSHIGSPATESCIVVGRTLKSLRLFLKVAGDAAPAARSVLLTDTTCTCPPPVTPNMFNVKTNASRL
jgi:hypothetical protein